MFNEKIEKRTLKAGWIEVIAGSMFSGKTEELIRRLRRAQYAQQKIEIFKPGVDTRYSKEEVVSHNEASIHSTPVSSSSNILLLSEDVDVVGIDEAQFFDDGLPEVCTKLAERGIRVVVAGLDMDFKGRPFGPMPYLFAIAEEVTKVHAICLRCGDLAQFSYRKVQSQEKVLLGETDSYEPLCRKCFIETTKKEQSE
ncbi:MAG TPA: thymidine kinase [Bacteroidales bacterium]|nr:thymidine kinase [Bacteroidales bacterium]